MDLIVDLASAQVVPGVGDPAPAVYVAMDTMTDYTEPVVRMSVTQANVSSANVEIQLSFTRDQMREHIKRCQLIMGQLPA